MGLKAVHGDWPQPRPTIHFYWGAPQFQLVGPLVSAAWNIDQLTERLIFVTWWRHQIETFSTSLAFCEGNPPVDSPHKRPVTWSFDIFFDLCLNKRLSNQSHSLWRHCNEKSKLDIHNVHYILQCSLSKHYMRHSFSVMMEEKGLIFHIWHLKAISSVFV